MPSCCHTESVGTESFVFQPPAGGDLTLQSCDGTTFQVHSVLLGLASTVFADMLVGATKSDTVELAEDAETVSLMLAFIYPVDPPSITRANQLEKIMILSQKYDIQRITKAIEGYNHPDNQLILADPIRVFRAAIKHNFPAVRALSAKASSVNHLDLYSVKGLEELAEIFPESSSVIGLIGAQLIRSKLLAELLKGPSISNVLKPRSLDDHGSSYMACGQCWNKTHYRDWYTPGWLPLWLSALHERLIQKPVDPCQDILSLLFIADLCDSPKTGCLACVKQTLTKRFLFERWARSAKNTVDEKLKELDKLHSL